LLDVLNEDALASPAHGGTYVEYILMGPRPGQSVFLNFDLSSVLNHNTGHCTGITPDPAPNFAEGEYDGRVELVRTILEDIFGLTPPFPGGGGGTSGVGHEPATRWALNQNAPNPSLSGTTIWFEVASSGKVEIRVYDSRGRLVRVLEDRRFEPGKHAVTWDGTNSSGKHVASGVYFYKMEAGDFTSIRKMIVLR
jgi:hypothetical protein